MANNNGDWGSAIGRDILGCYIFYIICMGVFDVGNFKGTYVITDYVWLDVLLTIDLWIIYITAIPLVLWLIYEYFKN